MNIRSLPSLESPVFTLMETYVFDIEINDDVLSLRLELFESQGTPNLYRCVMWECAGMASEVSVVEQDGTSTSRHDVDNIVNVDWSAYLGGGFDCFEAQSLKFALEKVVRAIRAEVDRVNGVRLQ